MIVSGIYKIVNQVDGTVYIGSSKNFSMRFSKHKWQLNKSVHENHHLQNAWNKYGSTAFRFEVVETCSNEDLLKREQEYLTVAEHFPDRYYNSNYISTKPPSPMGRKATSATRLKLSSLRKGKNNPRFGKRVSSLTKQKMSDAKAKEYVISSPTNETTHIRNLHKFCKDHGLNSGGMYNGRYSQYRGWKKT